MNISFMFKCEYDNILRVFVKLFRDFESQYCGITSQAQTNRHIFHTISFIRTSGHQNVNCCIMYYFYVLFCFVLFCFCFFLFLFFNRFFFWFTSFTEGIFVNTSPKSKMRFFCFNTSSTYDFGTRGKPYWPLLFVFIPKM